MLEKLKLELTKLPANFAMINRSVVVNLRHIKEFLPEELIMDNGDVVVISKNYKETLNMKMLEMQMEWNKV